MVQGFQVTRRGRAIYAGGLDGLVEAAARGEIRADDLVFDPGHDDWRLARDLPSLAGFALRSDRARWTDHPGRLPRDRPSASRRGTRIVQALSVLGTIALIWAWVRVPSPPAPLDTRIGGAPPAVAGAAPHAPRAGPGAPASPGAVIPPGADRPAAPKVGPPAELVFDDSPRDAPGAFVEPTPAERARYAARFAAEGRRTLHDPTPPPGDARLAQVLAARHRAEFARLNLRALDPGHPDIEPVDQLIADLEAVFGAACQPAHGEPFCALKLNHPDWPDAIVERVADGRAEVGMTAEQAHTAWGRPTRVQREGDGRRDCYDAACARSLRVIDRVVVEVGG